MPQHKLNNVIVTIEDLAMKKLITKYRIWSANRLADKIAKRIGG